MDRRINFSFFLFTIYSLIGYASGANATVTGIVRSGNGELIEFATVYVKRAAVGTITDEKGAYYLEIPAGEYEFVVTHS